MWSESVPSAALCGGPALRDVSPLTFKIFPVESKWSSQAGGRGGVGVVEEEKEVG